MADDAEGFTEKELLGLTHEKRPNGEPTVAAQIAMQLLRSTSGPMPPPFWPAFGILCELGAEVLPSDPMEKARAAYVDPMKTAKQVGIAVLRRERALKDLLADVASTDPDMSSHADTMRRVEEVLGDE